MERTHVHYNLDVHTDGVKAIQINCVLRYDELGRPYPVLHFANVVIFPSDDQLIQLQQAISEYFAIAPSKAEVA